MNLLDRLLGHDRWATNVLLDIAATLSPGQMDRTFDIGHESLRQTFIHLIFNVAAWTANMRGQDVVTPPEDITLRAWFDQAYDAFASFARQIEDDGRFDDTFIDSWNQPQTYGGAILHVILHDAEHRTEILHIFNHLGVENVPEIDHALWDFVRRDLVSD